MGRPRPTPRTDADEYAAATLEVLDELRDLMRDVRDRLPAPPQTQEGGPVELREPAPARGNDPAVVERAELAEPKAPASLKDAEGGAAPAPAGSARRRKSTQTRKGS